MNDLKPLSVKQLNTYVKNLLESDTRLLDITVTGEISNFKAHYSSGHWYFTVKDGEASVRCAMFRGYNSRVTANVCDGMQVIIRGKVSLYEKDGQFMFYAYEIYEAGIGELAVMFEKTKQKLQAEGLFDAENKRQLPKFPKTIAVITSDSGAAIKDILNILKVRYPICNVITCPAVVQGVFSVKSIIDTLDKVYSFSNIDLIIVGRGGGSAEDLAAFNDEALARKIYESPVPVISAVGHETDFTICDFVADVRAATPSHAVQLAVPDVVELFGEIKSAREKLNNGITNKFNFQNEKYSRFSKNISKQNFEKYILEKEKLYSDAFGKFKKSTDLYLKIKEKDFVSALKRADALNPFKTIERGFTAVKQNGDYKTSVSEIKTGDNISVIFKDGSADCTVNSLKKGKVV